MAGSRANDRQGISRTLARRRQRRMAPLWQIKSKQLAGNWLRVSSRLSRIPQREGRASAGDRHGNGRGHRQRSDNMVARHLSRSPARDRHSTLADGWQASGQPPARHHRGICRPVSTPWHHCSRHSALKWQRSLTGGWQGLGQPPTRHAQGAGRVPATCQHHWGRLLAKRWQGNSKMQHGSLPVPCHCPAGALPNRLARLGQGTFPPVTVERRLRDGP